MPQLPSDMSLHLVNTIDKAMEMKSWLGERRPKQVLGFDTETHGLDLYAPHAKLRMIQIGDEKTGWAVPWERWGGVAIEIMDEWEGEFTAHNLSFDAKAMKVLADYDIPWDKFHDTMIMAQIDAPGAPAALKILVDKHIDPRASVGQKRLSVAFKNNGWDWATVPVDYEDYWVYSALDPVLASHLFNHYSAIPQKYKEVYDLEMAVRRICTNIEHVGMRIDLDYTAQRYEELNQKIESCKEWAENTLGINIASGPQLAKFFSEDLGASFEHITATGKPSVNKDQLDLFAKSENQAVANIAQFVLQVRKYEKLNSSYFKNFLTMHDDGVLHPSFRTLGARTGRMSITDPALQTLPSGDNLIRGAFISRRDGETLISCDYSQVEMRILAHLSDDEALIAAFNEADEEGSDFFVAIGKMVYNDPDFSKEDKRRKLIKGLMYGSAYGSGIAKMAWTAGVSFDQMSEVADALFTKFPGIKRFMSEIEKLGESRYNKYGVGYIELESGRRLPADPGKMYTLTNYNIQGLAAELMKRAVVRLDAAGLGPYLQMIIHDECIFSVPDAEVDHWMPIIEECMSYIDGEFKVKLPAEPEILGKRWGDGDKYAA